MKKKITSDHGLTSTQTHKFNHFWGFQRSMFSSCSVIKFFSLPACPSSNKLIFHLVERFVKVYPFHKTNISDRNDLSYFPFQF